MQAGSVRKRKQIPSDDEEEESSHLTHTPDPQLRKRTEKESAAKVKRGLRLEELRQKRTKSLAKKILPQDSHINSSLTESLEACEQDVLEEDEHVQELPLDDNHDGSEWYQTFPQELCSSSVDSEEDPKNPGSQDESQETFSSADNDSEEEDDLSDFIDFEGACRRPRTITQLFCFYQELNGEIVRKFRIGCYCADKALIYHRIHHYCSVELKKACEEKLGVNYLRFLEKKVPRSLWKSTALTNSHGYVSCLMTLRNFSTKQTNGQLMERSIEK